MNQSKHESLGSGSITYVKGWLCLWSHSWVGRGRAIAVAHWAGSVRDSQEMRLKEENSEMNIKYYSKLFLTNICKK